MVAVLFQPQPIGAVGAEARRGLDAFGIGGDIPIDAKEVLQIVVAAANAREVLIVVALGGVEAEELYSNKN